MEKASQKSKVKRQKSKVTRLVALSEKWRCAVAAERPLGHIGQVAR